jgi:acyl-CoA synthetase (AMP-forming)/AMP-acid ligase II
VAQNTRDLPRKRGSVGPAFAGLALRAVDAAGRPLPPGEVGELVVRGDTVMQGYWNLPARTAEVLRDGWLHTGDLGALDEEGYCTILGRMDDMILRGGENVAPREVEEALLAHPAVAEAAVVGAPDAVLGQVVCAFVVVREGCDASAEGLQRHAAQRLAPYKRPARIRFVAELPRNSTGKILRHLLKDEELE